MALKAVAYVSFLVGWISTGTDCVVLAAGPDTYDCQQMPHATPLCPPDHFLPTCLLRLPRQTMSFGIQSVRQVQSAQPGHQFNKHLPTNYSLPRMLLSRTCRVRELEPSVRLGQRLAPNSQAVLQPGRSAQRVHCLHGAEGLEAPREPRVWHRV